MINPNDPWLEFVRIAVPASLVIIGWLVLYESSKSLEKRKEIRQFVEIILSLIDEISELSRQYYSPENLEHESHVSHRITTSFTLLSHYRFLLSTCGVEMKITVQLNAFKQTITGGYFQTEKHLNQLELPNWLAECAAAEAKLKLAVNRAYFDWADVTNQSVPSRIGWFRKK